MSGWGRTRALRPTAARPTGASPWQVRRRIDPLCTVNSYDMDLHNALGLAYAQAAGYGFVTALDLDERPGDRMPSVRPMLWRSPTKPYARLFFRTKQCNFTYCPPNKMAFLQSCRVGANLGAVVKIMGVPSRLAAIGTHGAVPAPGYNVSASYGTYDACLSHPHPVVLNGQTLRITARAAAYLAVST